MEDIMRMYEVLHTYIFSKQNWPLILKFEKSTDYLQSWQVLTTSDLTWTATWFNESSDWSGVLREFHIFNIQPIQHLLKVIHHVFKSVYYVMSIFALFTIVYYVSKATKFIGVTPFQSQAAVNQMEVNNYYWLHPKSEILVETGNVNKPCWPTSHMSM